MLHGSERKRGIGKRVKGEQGNRGKEKEWAELDFKLPFYPVPLFPFPPTSHI